MTTLTIGIVWRDDAQAVGLDDKVRLAVADHVRQYNEQPNVCFVHPSDLPGGEAFIDGMRVVAKRTVSRYRFWLGVESE